MAPLTRSPEEVRALLHGAFVYALLKSGASRAAVAKWIERDETTLRRWVRQEATVDVAAVARAGRVWPHFLRCLIAVERKAKRL